MNWQEIKNSIKESLLNRNLKYPAKRLGALDNLEKILNDHFKEFILDPQKEFSIVGKEELKKKLAIYKSNGKLNDAEESIINEIYYRIL